jgi:hypothetical protein
VAAKVGKCLVIHMAGLGDLVVALPGLLALVDELPTLTVTLAADDTFRRLADLADLPVIHAPLAELPWRGLWDHSVDPAAAGVGHFDTVIELWTLGQRAERYIQATGGRVAWLPPDPGSYKWGIMAERAFRWFKETFRLDGQYRELELAPCRECLADVETYLHGRSINPPYAVIAPGAGGVYKCWPEANWWELGRKLLKDAGVQVVACLGPREAGRGMQAPPDACTYVAKEWPIDSVSALVGNAAVYCGNDSGVSHVAVWSVRPGGGRVPCVLTFARLNMRAWCSFRPWVTALPISCATPGSLTVEEVYGNVLRVLQQ